MTEAADTEASLEVAAQTLEETSATVEERGKDDLRAVADALNAVEGILDQYEARATDRDDLKGYIKFRETLSERLDEIPADIPHSEAFIEANKALTTGIASTLSSSDFEKARRALHPAREDAQLLESWHDARKEYERSRHAATEKHRELEARIDELTELRELGEADLDAPTDDLSEPINAYNKAATTAFEQFRHDAPARDVLHLLAAAESYPLVELPSPPERLQGYIQTADVGTEPVSKLVDLAEFSRSKLQHYVGDPKAFSAGVSTNRTFLDQLSADPLTVSWPPSPAIELRWRARELVAVVSRFADEETVARAREVHELTWTDEYERLRATAVASEKLTSEQRTRLENGEIDAEIEVVRANLHRLEDVLDEYPPLS